VQLDGFGDLKIGMMRCSKIAFESGSAASAVATPKQHQNSMCWSRAQQRNRQSRPTHARA
jgi:hypothetical protein